MREQASEQLPGLHYRCAAEAAQQPSTHLSGEMV